MILYQDMNNGVHVYSDGYFDSQPNHDALLKIAAEIYSEGYEGITFHTKQLHSGEYFVAINHREDTPEGEIFSRIKSDFEEGLPIPNSHQVLKEIRRADKKRKWR